MSNLENAISLREILNGAQHSANDGYVNPNQVLGLGITGAANEILGTNNEEQAKKLAAALTETDLKINGERLELSQRNMVRTRPITQRTEEEPFLGQTGNALAHYFSDLTLLTEQVRKILAPAYEKLKQISTGSTNNPRLEEIVGFLKDKLQIKFA